MTIIAPKAATSRDHRIDFWRGVALVMIFFNHVPGTLWENFTSRNFGFSDAAELFVFLAGFAAAFAYGRPFLAGNRLIASVKAFRRAGVLYLVQMMLTMLAVGLFSWAAMVYGDGGFFQRINLESILLKPLDTMFGFAVLGHQLGYVNILPMYSALLIMVPALLWLASKSLNLMLGASIALWMAAWTFRLDLPNYPNPGGWFFNPIAWQLIFAVGLYCGLRKASGRPSVPYRPWLFWSALAFLIGSFVVTEYGLWSYITAQQSWLPGFVAAFDKTYATAPRLLHVLALAYVFANAAPTSVFASISKSNPLARLGRHSLPVFALGTMLSLICQVILWERDASFVLDTLLLGACLSLQFALAWWLEWWGDYQKRVSTPKKSVELVRSDEPVPGTGTTAGFPPAKSVTGAPVAVNAGERPPLAAARTLKQRL
ncbi:MAG: OpgC domain-containing protein [Pseudomonadota bacterium]|nr:OpgC domain-containing protein [Pseudomonadota bacterium]